MLDDSNNVKILDWKNTKLASSMLDVSFFLLSSVSYELRSYTEDFLKLYYDTYCNRLSNMKVDVEISNLQDIFDDYKTSAQFSSLQVLLILIPK